MLLKSSQLCNSLMLFYSFAHSLLHQSVWCIPGHHHHFRFCIHRSNRRNSRATNGFDITSICWFLAAPERSWPCCDWAALYRWVVWNPSEIHRFLSMLIESRWCNQRLFFSWSLSRLQFTCMNWNKKFAQFSNPFATWKSIFTWSQNK